MAGAGGFLRWAGPFLQIVRREYAHRLSVTSAVPEVRAIHASVLAVPLRMLRRSAEQVTSPAICHSVPASLSVPVSGVVCRMAAVHFPVIRCWMQQAPVRHRQAARAQRGAQDRLEAQALQAVPEVRVQQVPQAVLEVSDRAVAQVRQDLQAQPAQLHRAVPNQVQVRVLLPRVHLLPLHLPPQEVTLPVHPAHSASVSTFVLRSTPEMSADWNKCAAEFRTVRLPPRAQAPVPAPRHHSLVSVRDRHARPEVHHTAVPMAHGFACRERSSLRRLHLLRAHRRAAAILLHSPARHRSGAPHGGRFFVFIRIARMDAISRERTIARSIRSEEVTREA